MKRLLLFLIIFFPAITLALWVYHGMHMRPPTTPPAASGTNITTNLNQSVDGK
jgi:hypothetical protein